MLKRVIDIYKEIHDLQMELGVIQSKCEHLIKDAEDGPHGEVEVCQDCDKTIGPANNGLPNFNMN